MRCHASQASASKKRTRAFVILASYSGTAGGGCAWRRPSCPVCGCSFSHRRWFVDAQFDVRVAGIAKVVIFSRKIAVRLMSPLLPVAEEDLRARSIPAHALLSIVFRAHARLPYQFRAAPPYRWTNQERCGEPGRIRISRTGRPLSCSPFCCTKSNTRFIASEAAVWPSPAAITGSSRKLVNRGFLTSGGATGNP